MTLPPIPSILVNALNRGSCVIFVGAGLSQGAGLPGWKGLLNALVSWCEENAIELPNQADLRDLINGGNLLTAAEAIKSDMPQELFRRALTEIIDGMSPSPTRTHLLLPKIPFAAALTSNYDRLLETSYAMAGTHPQIININNQPGLMTSLRDGRFYILKAHGTIEQIETIIFGSSSYRELMLRNTAYRAHLETVFRTKTVLFIGYSLSDPDLQMLLEQEHIFSGGYALHYALMSADEFNPLVQREWVQRYGIQMLPYKPSTEYHPEVEDFLEELARLTIEPPSESVVQSIRPEAVDSGPASQSPSSESTVSIELHSSQRQINDALNALSEFVKEGNFASSIRLPAEVEDFQLLRLQLLISTWLIAQLPSSMLGNHEANRLYLHRERLQPTASETFSLLRMLLSVDISYVPGWYWFRRVEDAYIEGGILHLAIADSYYLIRQRAFDLLASAKVSPTEGREEHLSRIVTSDPYPEVRRAALSYIGSVGAHTYLPVVGSALVDRDRAVSTQAKISKYLLLARAEPDRALSELLDETGIEVDSILNELLPKAGEVTTATLLRGLGHSTDRIRLFAIEELVRRGEFTVELASSLRQDKDNQVKAVAYRFLIEQGTELHADEIATKLPEDYFRGAAIRNLMRISSPSIDRDKIVLEFYRRYSFDELIQMTDWSNWPGHEAYRALALEHFSEFAERIREDLQTDFAESAQSYYQQQLGEWQRSVATPPDSFPMPPRLGFLSMFRPSPPEQDPPTAESLARSDVARRKIHYITAALAGLALNGSPEDIEFGRRFLFHEDNEIRIEAVKVLQRFGSRDDLPGLIRIAKSSDGLLQEVAAKAALVVSRNQPDVAGEFLETSNEILVSISVVELIKHGDKEEIGGFLRPYLNSDNDKVRTRVMAFYVFRYDNRELEDLLSQYTSQASYYYDVVCCFDRILYAPLRLATFYRRSVESSFFGLLINEDVSSEIN